MNEQDEIIEMATQVGIKYRALSDEFATDNGDGVEIEQMHAFAKLIAEREREACADIAENWRCNGMPRTGVANEIRARGQA